MRALFAATLLLIAACADATGLGDEVTRLHRAEARWAASGPRDYRFTLTRVCECASSQLGPVVIEVRAGTVEARTTAQGATVDPQFDDLFTNVPGLFDLIRSAIDLPAAALAVRYHDGFGYPESIQIDWVAGAVDDEVSYRITDLEALPRP